MSVPTGKYSVTSLTKLRQRCSRPEPGNPDGCWLWKGCTDDKGSPRIWFSADGKPRTISGPRVAALLDGREIPKGYRAWQTCGEKTCCNPRHTVVGTMAEWGAWSRENKADWIYTAKRLTAQKAASRKTGKIGSLDEAREIRNSTRSIRAEARARGVSRATIISIRHQRTWAEPNPFAGLGAR